VGFRVPTDHSSLAARPLPGVTKVPLDRVSVGGPQRPVEWAERAFMHGQLRPVDTKRRMAVLDGPLNGTETLTDIKAALATAALACLSTSAAGPSLRFQDDAELSRAGSCHLIIADHGGPVRGRCGKRYVSGGVGGGPDRICVPGPLPALRKRGGRSGLGTARFA
jgi:hypothetical protein